MNENMLCPKCGYREKFFIGTREVEISSDSPVSRDNLGSYCRCLKCEHVDELYEFRLES